MPVGFGNMEALDDGGESRFSAVAQVEARLEWVEVRIESAGEMSVHDSLSSWFWSEANIWEGSSCWGRAFWFPFDKRDFKVYLNGYGNDLVGREKLMM